MFILVDRNDFWGNPVKLFYCHDNMAEKVRKFASHNSPATRLAGLYVKGR